MDFALRFLSPLLITSILFLSGCRKTPSSQEQEETVLHHQLRSKVQALDPAQAGDTMSDAVASDIFECLYGYHYLKRPYEIIPVLADGMPKASEDRLTYKIRIKKGVYFHDNACFQGGKGRELKASDFVFAWKRIADIKTLSRHWWVFNSRIVGLDEFRQYSKT